MRTASIRNSNFEVTCAKCGDALIAPEWVEYFGEGRLVLNLWSCTSCGFQFETEANVPANAESKIDSKVMKEFFRRGWWRKSLDSDLQLHQ